MEKGIFNEQISNLFKQADQRIADLEAKRIERINAQIEAKNRLVIETTQKYAESIISLVKHTLSTAVSNKGNLSLSQYPNIGFPIPNDRLEDFFSSTILSNLAKPYYTGYEIDNLGLHITLNFSRWGEGCVDETYGGSFNDVNIDYNYLAELLNPYLIFVDKKEEKDCDGGTGSRRYYNLIVITAYREKSLVPVSLQHRL